MNPSIAKQARTKGSTSVPTGGTRLEKLVELIDHCTAAKETSDAIGEKFLSYLLSMAIQESRTAMRQTPRN